MCSRHRDTLHSFYINTQGPEEDVAVGRGGGGGRGVVGKGGRGQEGGVKANEQAM